MKTIFILTLLVGLFSFDYVQRVSSRTLEKNLVKIDENLYANKYETTNEEYRLFLSAIQSEIADVSAFEIKAENWIGSLGDPYRDHYHTYPGFNQFPVLNISHTGANEFCSWLTRQYNSDPNRKFNKVQFRLPTEKEWLKAAKGTNESAIYPWGNESLRNKDGLYHCNYFRIDEAQIKIPIEDRSTAILLPSKGASVFTMPAAVNTHTPNTLGLYNISGNAAEMISIPGHTKGGSWGSSGYYVRLDAEDEFRNFDSSIYVGFRYFMEVIEK